MIFFLLYFYQKTIDNDENNILQNNLLLVENFTNKKIIFNILKKPNKKITKYQTFYDVSIFPQLKQIKYQLIKNELDNYLKNTQTNWIDWVEYDLWKNNNNKSSWKIIPLMCFGSWTNVNTNIFPNTINELKKIDGLVNAGFSKLGPNTTLTLHKGWGRLSNNILRCHLGIVVPTKTCKLFVIGSSNDIMYQKEGKLIIFDDSLYHSASNEHNTTDRIVLILDIKRPEYIEKGVSDVEDSEELNNFINEFT
jgi:beta-hydroxylase